MTSLEHLSDEDLLRLVNGEESVQRRETETPYEFSRESRSVGGHMKTLFGKVKKSYHRVKDYLPSPDTILMGTDALAAGGAVMTPVQMGLYGASHLVRHIPKVGKHLAVPLAVAGVGSGAIKRVNAMRRGAGFLPPGVGMNRPNYMPNAEVLVDGTWRVADRHGNVVAPAARPGGSYQMRRPHRQ